MLPCEGAEPGPLADPRLFDVWHFEVQSEAALSYQVAICDFGRARLWTSFGGTGQPDLPEPLEGTWELLDSQIVATLFPAPPDAMTFSALLIGYASALDQFTTLATDPDFGWALPSGVRLSTVGVVVAAVVSTLRGNAETQLWGRRIATPIIFRAVRWSSSFFLSSGAGWPRSRSPNTISANAKPA